MSFIGPHAGTATGLATCTMPSGVVKHWLDGNVYGPYHSRLWAVSVHRHALLHTRALEAGDAVTYELEYNTRKGK